MWFDGITDPKRWWGTLGHSRLGHEDFTAVNAHLLYVAWQDTREDRRY